MRNKTPVASDSKYKAKPRCYNFGLGWHELEVPCVQLQLLDVILEADDSRVRASGSESSVVQTQ